MIKECEETNLNDNSKVPSGVTFISYDNVIDFIKEQLKSNQKDEEN